MFAVGFDPFGCGQISTLVVVLAAVLLQLI
jgi:hypothetical protein